MRSVIAVAANQLSKFRKDQGVLFRKNLPMTFFAFLSLSTLASAAPTEQEKARLAAVFDYNAADDLANLQVCKKPELHSQYLQALIGAGIAHPNTDPAKIAALVREIQRKSTALAGMRKHFNEGTPPDEIDSGCRFDVGQAVKHLEVLDDLILSAD